LERDERKALAARPPALWEAKLPPALTAGQGCRPLVSSADRAQNLAAVTEPSDTEVFQVLICQIAENQDIDIVVSKALSLLGHSEFFEPISNLLHRRLYRRLSE
jgi:hypothetical protein